MEKRETCGETIFSFVTKVRNYVLVCVAPLQRKILTVKSIFDIADYI